MASRRAQSGRRSQRRPDATASIRPPARRRHLPGARGGLGALRRAFPLAPGQSGALFALGDDQLCLDYVSRPAAFARLYPKLLEGYLLDGLDRLDRKPGSQDRLTAFAARAATAPVRQSASAGLGEDIRLAADRIIGSGLMLDDELLQLSLFTTDGSGPRTRVARPSRRR